MPNFHVRVELHGASGEGYEQLHERMRQSGFERQVQGSRALELPTGTYWYEGSKADGEEIRATVRRIASSVKATPDPFVFVSGIDASGDHTWWGYLKTIA